MRILIVDDHPLYRWALSRLIEGHANLQVVGEAGDGQEAVELCRRLCPELVLMDIRMPKMDGLAATRAITQTLPSTTVLVLTAFGDPGLLSEALKAGAAGYLLKDADPEEILGAIHKVSVGESPLNQEVAMGLLVQLLKEEPPKRHNASAHAPCASIPEEHSSPPVPGALTQREIEVLRLMAQGRTNEVIARSLLVSVSTAKKHVRRIMSKLGVSSRTQAVVRAIELELLSDQDHVLSRRHVRRLPSP